MTFRRWRDRWHGDGGARELLALAWPLIVANSFWNLQIALDRSLEEDLLASYRAQLGLVLGTALVLCTLTGYWIARRGLRPVAEIVETARRMRCSQGSVKTQ